MVETTPIVFDDRLYRFEYVREKYKPNKTGDSYFCFIDVESGEPATDFAAGQHLGSAYVEGDTVFAFGVDKWGGSAIRAFWSKDLVHWSSQVALNVPGWGMYNSSVCKARDRYVMAVELGEPPEEVGVGFTIRFVESSDLLNWHLTSSECVYSKDRYTACPALRFLGGNYYMIYLEARPGPTYEPHIVTSEDLIHWRSSIFNPIMHFSADDKKIANSKLTPEQREHIARAVNINNSDVDLCEFKGETVIYYSWGNQRGTEFLAEAFYEGTLEDFLTGFFAEAPCRDV